jgi:hypothetical protein
MGYASQHRLACGQILDSKRFSAAAAISFCRITELETFIETLFDIVYFKIFKVR